MATTKTSTGPLVTVNDPTGDLPCAGTPTNPCPPAACCGLFNLSESTGESALLSYGGPFLLSPPILDQACDSQCGSLCGPVPLSGYGILDGVICLGTMAPGTYQIYFRAELLNAISKQRIVALFFPDCNNPDPNTAFVISDYAGGHVGPIRNPQTGVMEFFPVQSCGSVVIAGDISVFSENCNPGVQLLFDPGCTTSSAPVTGAELRNLQFKALRQSSRDLINCNGSPLVPGVVGLVDFALVSTTPANGAINVVVNAPINLDFNKLVDPMGMVGLSPPKVSLFRADTPGTPVTLTGAPSGLLGTSFDYTHPALASGVLYVVTYTGVTSLCHGAPPLTGSFTFTTA